jgi:hypothetical protein
MLNKPSVERRGNAHELGGRKPRPVYLVMAASGLLFVGME